MKKLNIIQIGVLHEHASGKFASLKSRPDIFNLLGYVDEREFCTAPYHPNAFAPELYAGYRQFTLDEALNHPVVEAVTIEVPNRDLVPTALRCLEHDLPMHMDKPAEDLAQFQKLLAGCEAKNLPFQMGFMFRGNPAFQFCIEAIKSKLIGEVFSIDADMNHCYGGSGYQAYLGKIPGGIMFNLGCHLIDFIAAALGRPEKVTPFLKSAPGYPDQVLNNALAVLEYPQATVALRASSCDVANVAGRAVKIAGTLGTIKFSPIERFDGKGVEIELTLAEARGKFAAGKNIVSFPPQRDRYEAQLVELMQIIRGEMQPTYSYRHDYLVQEITSAAAGLNHWRSN